MVSPRQEGPGLTDVIREQLSESGMSGRVGVLPQLGISGVAADVGAGVGVTAESSAMHAQSSRAQKHTNALMIKLHLL